MNNSIYVDIDSVITDGATFNFIYGARGKGKTYSGLRNRIQRKEKMLYLRTKQEEFKISCSEEGNPFKKLNSDFGWEIKFNKGPVKSIIDPDGNHYGYGAALTTFGNVRGADWSDVDIILWDEFIQQRTDKRIKGLDQTFYNMYESVNRNREFEGKPPVKVIALSNANSFYCQIFASLGIIPSLEKMVKKGEHKYYNPQRSLAVYSLAAGEYEELKKQTALHRLLPENTQYSRMALKNEFAYDSWFGVSTKPLVEYYPICSLDDAYIYRHKHKNLYYVSRSHADCPAFNTTETYALFMRNHGIILKEACITGRVHFEDLEMKYMLAAALNL